MSQPNPFNAPGVDAMTSTLDFVKNLWGGMKVPGMAMPSLSVDDINKQISDLKAVESWMLLNMNMLRGTIQALEVQSATISTLQSMSAAMNTVGKQTPSMEKPADKPPFESPFSFTPPPATAPSSSPEASPQTGEGGPAIDPAAQFANPAAWWNMLQDQFKQAVNSAMAPDAAPAAPAAAEKAAPEPEPERRKRKTPPKA